MDEPLISVIVPVYNVAPYIARCVDSILLQSHKNMEIVLVDDGSTDASGRIADELASKHENIVVIHQENSGVSAARNAGLRKSAGAYIGFVDPDDYIDKEMYHDLYLQMKVTEADVAACCWQDEFENQSCSIARQGVDAVFSGDEAIKFDLSHGTYITCNKLFSRKVCHNLFYDEDTINGEDRLFDIMALLNADRAVYVNKPYYHYCHRLNSAGTKKYTSKDKSLLAVCERVKRLLADKDEELVLLAETQRQQACYQLLGMMKFDIRAYQPDGEYILREMRKQLGEILTNRYLGIAFKLKAVIVCVSPRVMRLLIGIKSKLGKD